MTASLNIAALTKRTGVPADTIRKWEQRYGVLSPARTAGGQRRFSELDVARIQWLKARLEEGYRIGEAAALLGRGESAALSTTELTERIVEATLRSDIETLERLVDQALALPSLESSFFDVLAPALVEVGHRWAAGEVDVAQEHLCSATVRFALERLLADTRPDVRGSAVLACAPGEEHELGLLMLAVLLRADGWRVAYLGANTPTGDALALAGSLESDLVCFSAGTADQRKTLDRTVARAGLPPGLQVLIGGRGARTADVPTTLATLRRQAS